MLNVSHVIRWYTSKSPPEKAFLVEKNWDRTLNTRIFRLDHSRCRPEINAPNLVNRVCITFTNYHTKSRSLLVSCLKNRLASKRTENLHLNLIFFSYIEIFICWCINKHFSENVEFSARLLRSWFRVSMDALRLKVKRVLPLIMTSLITGSAFRSVEEETVVKQIV